MELAAQLESIGLTRGESEVYLALLRLGQTTTGDIIKESDISASKVYIILDRLMEKGLASYIIIDSTKHFTAASPKRILDYMDERQEAIEQKKQTIKELMPTLLAQQEQEQAYEAKLYQGTKGVQTAIYDVLRELTRKDTILAMGIQGTKAEKYNAMWIKWHRERARKRIPVRAIFTDKRSMHYQRIGKMPYVSARVLKGITPSTVDIMGDYVLIFTFKSQPSCMVIKNKAIAQSFTTFFENLWSLAAL